jgi:Na+:H+ antiporter, NhaA family
MREHALPHHPIAAADDRPAAGARIVRFVADRFLLLPTGALIALAWANTAAESYFEFSHAIGFFVNEIAMALFLGLLAQEVLEAMMPGGALHTWRRWGLPVVTAAGGGVGAVVVYLSYVQLMYEPVLTTAWPVACAIDAAAAYYVLKTVWPRTGALPFVLLMTLAADGFGVLIVARPTLSTLQPSAIALMLSAIIIAVLLRAVKVREIWPYVVLSGVPMWFALYFQGIHPALALIPIVPFLPREPRSADFFADRSDDDYVHHFEHEWNDAVQIVLFLFGLANAGVVLNGYGTGTWALLTAALVGRPLGIAAAAAIAVTVGLRLPPRIGWRELAVVALATSSGFTFALFFATGAIPLGPVLAEIKLGALASVAAAPLTILLARLLKVGRFAR